MTIKKFHWEHQRYVKDYSIHAVVRADVVCDLTTLFFFVDAHLLLCCFLQINYMDPRITVAWCKRNEVPIEKVFSKTLRDKFNWAMAVEPEWEFNAKIADQ
jgi:hypothetical protein